MSDNFRKDVCDLIKQNGYKRIAEVGVWRGVLSEMIHKTSPDVQILVDPLEMDWNNIGKYTCTMGEKNMSQEELDRIAENLDRKYWTFYRLPSSEASEKVADGSLDFVFIDAVHLYDYVVEDITLWLPKINKGGIIAGDDIGGKHGKEVEPAVRKFFPDYNRIGKVWYQLV